MKYINFQKNHQTIFLRNMKANSKLTWKELAKILNINRSMIYFYLNEHSKLPCESYHRLCQIANMPICKNIEIVEIKNSEEKIRIPKLTEKLAEFIGALAGDGHMNNLNYEVSICMDKDIDKDYFDHVVKLFCDLFGLTARKYISKTENYVKCKVYSKNLVEFLNQNYGCPVGKKKGKLTIPDIILQNNELLKAYLRGMFDTDGSFHRHHKNDAIVGYCSLDEKHMTEIQDALTQLGYNARLHGKNLHIYQKEHIERFFREIKPSNEKHLMKYRYYKVHGRVPLNKELFNR